MTKVLIIEDEQIAADRLIRLLSGLDGPIEVIDHLDSVRTSVEWFNQNKEPDLLFLDIKLSDGLSFEIFEQVKVSCPIIFTTAYDQYALKAFKTNSIDYLLKPISDEELQAAFEKFKQRTLPQGLDFSKILTALGQNYKERFVVKLGEHLKSIPTDQVEVFHSKDKATYLYTKEGKKFLIDYSLSDIETMIDPAKFFRINRASIVNLDGIKDIISYSTSRLKVLMNTCEDEEFIVARERVGDFKEWLG